MHSLKLAWYGSGSDCLCVRKSSSRSFLALLSGDWRVLKRLSVDGASVASAVAACDAGRRVTSGIRDTVAVATVRIRCQLVDCTHGLCVIVSCRRRRRDVGKVRRRRPSDVVCGATCLCITQCKTATTMSTLICYSTELIN